MPMHQIIYFLAGFIIGILLCGLVYYFFFHKQKYTESDFEDQINRQRKQLAQYKLRQQQLENEKNTLTEQLQIEQQNHQEEQQNWQKERDDLLLNRAEQESSHLLEQTFSSTPNNHTDQTVHWQEERQQWLAEQQTIRHELEQLREEKEVLESSLRHTTERRRQDRDKLQQELMELQQQITDLQQQNDGLQVARKSSQQTTELGDTPATDWETQLHRRQDAWRRERRILHTQITKTQADKKVLEAKLVEQRVQAEKEKQALEEEIEQLMDRMLKLQLDNEPSSG